MSRAAAQGTALSGHLSGRQFQGGGQGLSAHLHSLVDTCGSYAFGSLYTGRIPEAAVALLHTDVLPFYAERGIPVGAILTDNGREFCGTEAHPFELYRALNDVAHHRTRVRSPQTHGFVKRFHGTVRSEFFQVALRQRFDASAEDLQPDRDRWLVHYNTERPHRGYRNRGKRPMDTISEYVTTVRQED